MGMANLRMVEGCRPSFTKSGGVQFIREPRIEIWGTNSEGSCWGVQKLGRRYVGGKEKGEE